MTEERVSFTAEDIDAMTLHAAELIAELRAVLAEAAALAIAASEDDDGEVPE